MEKTKIWLGGPRLGCGLIIPYRSKVLYGNQVAGRRRAEHYLGGFFVPVPWVEAAQAMEMVFCGDPLSEADADRIDAKLVQHGARVGRSEIDQPCESWVWLALDRDLEYLENRPCTEAVFTRPDGD